MFGWTYLRHELTRRSGRTILTVTGLAVGVALVVAITAVAGGLDDAQRTVLHPLSSVGTDLLVTRPVQVSSTATGGAGGGGGGGFGLGGGGNGNGNGNRNGNGLSLADRQALVAENQSVITDLSKLGKPGDHFVHDFFLPATQLTFPATQTATVAKLPGVAEVAPGLTLLAEHQEGTVPQIVAQVQTGGEQVQVQQNIAPPTPAEEAQIRACIDNLRQQAPAGQNGAGGTGQAPQQGPQQGQGRQGGGDGFGPGPGFGGRFRECLPARFQQFRGTFTTPQRTITQALNPPQTDITSAQYTIAGVDPSHPNVGLVTRAQLTSGTFLETGHQALLADAYAQRKGLKLGSTLDLNGTTFTVVGLVDPPLGGQAADVYLSLADLQTLSSRAGRVNVLLVRADKAADVGALTTSIQKAFPGATVTSSQQLADKVSGSLVDAGNLSKRLGGVLAVVVLIAAFLVAALLTLSSVAKRVRELGTLKAIGWRQSRVVRQVIGESVVQGVLGGLLGAALGIGAAVLAVHLSPNLQATAPASTNGGVFGLGQVAAGPTSRIIALSAPVHVTLLLAGLGLAVLGGLLAGAAGALRTARLRPADALRDLG